MLDADDFSTPCSARLIAVLVPILVLYACDTTPIYQTIAAPKTALGAAGSVSASPPRMPDAADGEPCSVDDDCDSGHCSNDICCSSGDCCATAMDCMGQDGLAATCDDEATCQGSRGDAMCVKFRCRTRDGVADDSGCDAKVEADKCGFYVSLFCNGQKDQTQPQCPDYCTDDSGCDENAHCEAGKCTPDAPVGTPCMLDNECATNHCGKGVCCVSGDCCKTADDCDPATYASAPSCDTPATCQGTSGAAGCQANQCVTMRTDDDSACDRNVIANPCGDGPAVKCQGVAQQVAPPPCATGTCGSLFAADSCNKEAFCYQSKCIPDQPNGEGCTGPEACQSGHCENNVCCTEGDCCENDSQCPAVKTCTNAGACEGKRQEKHCDTDKGVCMNDAMVDDDSGCMGQVAATDCGLNLPATCTGAEQQTMPPTTSCPACLLVPICGGGLTYVIGMDMCGRYVPTDGGLPMLDTTSLERPIRRDPTPCRAGATDCVAGRCR